MAMKHAARSKTHNTTPDLQAYETAYEVTEECVIVTDSLVGLLSWQTIPLLSIKRKGAASKRCEIDAWNKSALELEASIKSIALDSLRTLLQNKERYENAVSAVGPELMDTRSERGPVQFPPNTWDTAHGAALGFRDQVVQEIRTALFWNSVRARKPPKDSTVLPGVEEVAENYEAVRQHFRQLGLGTWPDRGALLSEIR
jgi:hypothetical protein